MSNTLLGFGLFALVAAIVGGGLKAFGFELGPLKSTKRQISLAVLGLALIVSAEWGKIQSLVFKPHITMETDGPTTIEPGETRKFPFSLTRGGRVEVVIQSLIPDWTSFSGRKGMPGQDGLYVSICSSKSSGACTSRQMAVSEAFTEELPPGSGTVSVFDFSTSPRMTVTLGIKQSDGIDQ